MQEPQAPARVRDSVPTSLSLLAAALVGAAHALVALAGMAVAVCADVDAAQFAAVLRVVVAAGRNGTVDRLVFHDAMVCEPIARGLVWRKIVSICAENACQNDLDVL